jgi:hypothetical protein
MVSVAQFKDSEDPRNQDGPNGLPGSYRVIVTLAKPGIPLVREDHHLPYEQLRGDSYLAISAPAYRHPGLPSGDRLNIAVAVGGLRLNFEGTPNESGFLAQLQCIVHAENFRNALFGTLRALLPSLSSIAAQLDVPLAIGQTDVVELRTGSRQMRIVSAYAPAVVAIPPSESPSPEYRTYTSLYREGLSSTSLRYQFLCFYKIIRSSTLYTREDAG